MARLSTCASALVAGALLAACAMPAGAATFRVNSTADLPDPAPGDGVCGVNLVAQQGIERQTAGDIVRNPARCTLRAAVSEANARSGADLILLTSGTYPLSRGELDVVGVRFRRGPDASLVPGPPRSTITIRGTGAFTPTITAQGRSRIFDVAGGPLLRGALTLEGVNLTGGRVTTGDGGAIRAGGPVTVSRSLMRGNQADGPGGSGSVISATAPVRLEDATITANTGADGALVLDGGGTLERVTVSANQVTSDSPTEVQAGALVAGLMAPVTVRNSTFADNVLTLARGDRLAVEIFSWRDTTLDHVTVRSRTDMTRRGLAGDLQDTSPKLEYTLRGSVIDTTCAATAPASLGGNVEAGDTCNLTDATDLHDADPLLGALGGNGGPTPTIPLLPGSPAIGRSGDCPATDQRGSPRPALGCDAGAFEVP